MKELLEWVRTRFQHPLILILFALGTVLLLMGVGQRLPWSEANALVADEPFERYGSLVIGGIFIVLAVVLMYRPPKGWMRDTRPAETLRDPVQATGPSPLAGEASLHNRRAALSGTQKRLLAFIEGERTVFLDAIKEASGIGNDAELYYRLEQLRLLGFIESERIEHGSSGEVTLVFRLSDAYLGANRGIAEDRTVSVPTRG